MTPVTEPQGDDLCPVLLVHGFASSAEHNWGQTGWLDLLTEDGKQTIAVDLPSHGQARQPTSAAEYEPVEAEVTAAIDGQGPVDAIGFSAGAQVLHQKAVHLGRADQWKPGRRRGSANPRRYRSTACRP